MKTSKIFLLWSKFIFILLLQRTPPVFTRALSAGPRNKDVLENFQYRTTKLKNGRENLLQSGCPDPGIPINGHRVLLVNLQPQKILGEEYFPIGAKLRFGCQADYLLRGSVQLNCEKGSDKKRAHWDSSAPQCVAPVIVRREAPDPCGSPPAASPFALTSSYVPGTSVNYSCLQDHTVSSGEGQLLCENGTWRGQPLQCRRLAVCEDDVWVSNGQRFLTGTREGDIVAFQCSEGYSLLGSRQLRCNSDGNWNFTWPLCLRVSAQCGDPGLSANSSRTVYSTREKGVVNYSCKFGHQLVGFPNRTCLSSGQWSGSLPTCKIIDCGFPGAIARGYVSFSSTTFGSEATYTCNSGHFLVGQSTTTCGSAGYWTSPPPTCRAAACPKLTPPMYGTVNISQTSNQYGSDAIFSCHTGFGMMGEPSRSCQADGTWSGRTPSCIMGSCGSLSSPVNGQVEVTHTRFGGYAFYSCDKGHIMEGTNARVCQIFGEWSLTPPTCRSVTCPVLTAPTNGSVFPSNSNIFASEAVYSCDPGFVMFGGSYMRECQDNGRWTGSSPSCFGMRCPRLTPPHNGAITYPSRVIGSEVVYTCNPGFELTIGDKIRTCLGDQKWSGIAPCCIQKDIFCPNLTSPTNGVVQFSNQLGGRASYECINSTQLLGDPTRTCQADGTWSGDEPLCFTPCPILPRPVGGNVSQNGTGPGSVACYSCDAGLALIGCGSAATDCAPCRTCDASGVWDGLEPICTNVSAAGDCGALPNPVNGSVDLSEGTRVNGRANYSCDEGFQLVGLPTRTCLGDEKWSGSAPTCTEVECGPLLSPSNGVVELGDGITLGAIAKYSCVTGHTINGSATRECLASGVWSGMEPMCLVISCMGLVNPANGLVAFNETVFTSVAVYSCFSGFSLNGTTTRLCQSDGSWSGVPPTCEVISCMGLVNPANGLVAFNETVFTSVAIYSCFSGFSLNGTTTRLCQSDGSWSGVPPTCEVISCMGLVNPANGLVAFNETVFTSVAVYSCFSGFSLNGTTTRLCQSDGSWSEVPPTCEVVMCEMLTPPSNGLITFSDSNVANSTAMYSCVNTSYVLVGDSIRRCTSNGWTGTPPTCNEVVCPELAVPNGGVVSMSTRSIGSLAEYSCVTGFRILGPEQRTCLQNGTWSDTEPACEQVVCPELAVPNGGVVSMSTRSIGSLAEYSCVTGFRILGPEQRTCLQNGTWSDTEPACEQIFCPELLSPPNGQVATTNRSVESLAEYSCVTGFRILGPEQRTCLQNGTWSDTEPTCEQIFCPELVSPPDGLVSLTNRSVGSLAEYSCVTGFRILGPEQRTCLQNGTWSDVEAVCEQIFCPELAFPFNGQVAITNRSIGSVAEYSCVTGFIIVGPEQRTCLQNGTWSDFEPTCEQVVCPELAVPNGGVVSMSTRSIGSMAEYSCVTGFRILGPEQRTCLQNGTWSDTEPTCEQIFCPELAFPFNGQVATTNRSVGSLAEYFCVTGFRILGPEQRICLQNGTWSDVEAVCEQIFCPELLSPPNGQVSLTNRSIGSVAEYACVTGFRILGPEQRTCLQNGTWTNIEPTCEEIRCPVLTSPLNGVVVVNGNRSIGSVAEYDCSLGFLMVGPNNRTCLQNGTWTGTDPICELISCPELVAPGNGSVNVSGRVVSSTASYSCLDSFFLEGEQERTCLQNGTWTGTAPSCTPIVCPALLDPVGGTVDTSDQRPGGVASYTCDSVLTLVGNEMRICGMDGEWEGAAPECRDLNCPALPNPQNGVVNVQGLSPMSQADYECFTGFGFNGSQLITCGPNGVWMPDPPTCISITTVTCPALPNPIDGSVSLTSRNLNGIATYECNSGFMLVGAFLRFCQVSETWSMSPPTCQPLAGTVSCPVLESPTDGEVSITTTMVGSMATFMCTTTGFVLMGSTVRECTDNGTWSGTQPTCEPVDCGDLQPPADGGVILPQGTRLGALAVYSCVMPGFLLEGVPNRLCQSDGMWSGNPPTCRLIDCGPLNPPASGTVDTSAGTVLSLTATYECDSGFRLVGDTTRTCSPTGAWSRAAPTCELIICPVLQNPEHGTVATSLGNMVMSVATYLCDFDSTAILFPRFCLPNGMWSGAEPTCPPQASMSQSVIPLPECPRLLPPPNGTVAITVDGFVSTAIFGCLRGFMLEGDSVQTCEAGQRWSGAPPTCKKLSCGEPEQPANGRLLAPEGFEVGSRVYFIPKDGYEHSELSSTAQQCGQDGQWSSPTPSFSAAGGADCSENRLDKFGRQCECTQDKESINCCRYRQEWSVMSDKDKHRYVSTVLLVSSNSTYQPLYHALVDKYHASFETLAQSTDSSVSHFLLWHRYFLLEYEDLLRIAHRDITIPYWDWTLAGHSPYSAPLFSDPETGFGNSSDPSTDCVTSGPFQELNFKIERPNDSSPKCLTRKYEKFIFPGDLMDTLASADLTGYSAFHEFVQIFLGLNIRCFVGGAMCSTRAPADPLFMLHLTGMDRFVQLWQERNPERSHFLLPTSGKSEDFLANTFDGALRLKDLNRNEDLAYGSCVKYSQATSREQQSGSSQDNGGSDPRVSLSSLCLMSESRISESGLKLSEHNREFISSICNVT